MFNAPHINSHTTEGLSLNLLTEIYTNISNTLISVFIKSTYSLFHLKLKSLTINISIHVQCSLVTVNL
jgi:hypothetical protein